MFIVLYGISASGKTTQKMLLKKWLESKGYKVLTTEEPSNLEIGKIIKRIIRGEITFPRKALVYLFVADRIHHTEKVIRPALEKGFIVICERYYLDTIAYHLLEGHSRDFLEEINKVELLPDFSIYIDISPETSLKRMGGECKKIYEKEDVLRKVRKNFLDLIEEYKEREEIYVVNGERSIEEVFREIKGIVEKKLNK